jgi:hypothetical protein
MAGAQLRARECDAAHPSADAWLSRHRDAIGKESTVDLKQLLPIDLFPPKTGSAPGDARATPSPAPPSSLRDAG